ncbi:MAG TPA: holo-ACP synthase [Bdellovibrionota bacterium]|nr:holo-ACP synthase [Bdellovibrionota bacterium]
MNPAPVGIGVDIESVSSFRSRKVSRHRRFYERLFSNDEMKYCASFRDPAPHFAVRFCAKEALVKAARGILPLHVTDAEVRNDKDGAPSFRPRSKSSSVRRFFSRYRPLVSLSHTDDQAIAFVILVPKRTAD